MAAHPWPRHCREQVPPCPVGTGGANLIGGGGGRGAGMSLPWLCVGNPQGSPWAGTGLWASLQTGAHHVLVLGGGGGLGGPPRGKDDTDTVGWGMLPFLKLLWLLRPSIWATLLFCLPGPWQAEAGLDLHVGLSSVLTGDHLHPQGLPSLPPRSPVTPARAT